jgi:hypothetical protein
MEPEATFRGFDRFLADRGLRLEAIVIGGCALNFLGVVSRPTRDCDVLSPKLPQEVRDAARAFAATQADLDEDWLNNGPASLAPLLPAGWEAEAHPIFEGTAVRLLAPGRLDLLRSKLFALCDRALDLPDCVALAPTPSELDAVRPWLREQDTNELWPAHVDETLADLARRLGHGT